MTPIALALSLFLADQPAVEAAAAPAAQAAAGAPLASGAPRDEYQFVAWCYGALRGYLDLHDEVMPEVVRIESSFRRPGSKLADDLKVYEAQQREGRIDLGRFQAALTAAEKASVKPINAEGAEAVRRGRAIWTLGPEASKARLAQEWMSWTLPARCSAAATALEKRATLLGASLKANAETSGQRAPAP